MAVDLIPTGLAAAALTAASRIIEAAIRRSRRTTPVEIGTLDKKVQHFASEVRELQSWRDQSDLEWRMNQLEIIARRHGWEIPRRATSGGDG